MPSYLGEYNELDYLRGIADTEQFASEQHFASESEALAGTSKSRLMSPLRTAQAIDAAAAKSENLLDGTVDPLALTFTERKRMRPFNLISPNFVEFEDNFEVNAGTWAAPTGGGSVAYANGLQTLTTSSNFASIFAKAGPKSAWWAVEARVASLDAGAAYFSIGVDSGAGRIAVVYDVAGTALKAQTTGGLIAGVSITLTAPFKIAAVLTERMLGVFVDTGDGWVLKNVWNISATTDFTAVTLSSWKYFWQSGTGTGAIALSSFRAGAFGELGIANAVPVIYEDGTPIMEGRHMFLSATSAGLDLVNAATYRQLHNAVYKWNIDTDALECVSKTLVYRTSKILGDISGGFMYDRGARIWRVFLQNTGDYGTSTPAQWEWHSEANLLDGFHVLTDGQVMTLPNSGTSLGHWDVYALKQSGTAYVAYSELGAGGLFPVLSSGTWPTGKAFIGSLSLVGARNTETFGEGLRIIPITGTTYVLSTSSVIGLKLVFNLAMTYLGTVTLPSIAAVGHPTIIPYPRTDGTTGFKVHTNDGTVFTSGSAGNYGTSIILEAAQTVAGYQYQASQV